MHAFLVKLAQPLSGNEQNEELLNVSSSFLTMTSEDHYAASDKQSEVSDVS